MKDKIRKIKEELAVVFDDDLHTKKWHNIVDWFLIALIVISTLEIFLSTFNIDPKLRRILFWVDMVTLFIFTIEVSLRIWVAPLVNPKYSGWKGRLRYCGSFHGFIDVISTYPFYLQWFIPFPITWLRTFRMARTVRLFRVSRYMKSWQLLKNTIINKRRELMISLQFLLVVTFILSLILFFCEHDAQPEAYDNGFTSVLWAFGQYIGDPGGFSETPPITGFGKFIACIVGLLGIAIVAVPAGILGSGFTEAIEHERDDEKLKENRKQLRAMFARKMDRPSRYQVISFFKTILDIQARTGMTENDIIETVNKTPGYRIINLASTIPVADKPHDRLAVEAFPVNRSYGVCIDRDSRVTIVSSGSLYDAAGGTFAFYIALMGGFNFISREIGRKIPPVSLYLLEKDREYTSDEQEFLHDLSCFAARQDSWCFDILAASGANEPSYPTHLHFGIGNSYGVETIKGDRLLIKDHEVYGRFYDDISATMESRFNIKCDNGKYHASNSMKIWSRNLPEGVTTNSVIVRMAWSAMLWDDRRLLIARTFAEVMNRVILGKTSLTIPDSMKTPGYAFEGYDIPNLATFC